MSTTNSNHGLRVYPNLVKNLILTKINQLWVADITYIRFLNGFVYLAIILDAFSRKVIGYALSRFIDQALTLSALTMAIETRKPPKGCIHHSDRGVQYAADKYIKCLTQNQFNISMARKGNPYDNATAESFMKTLKTESVYVSDYDTYQDIIATIFHFIDTVYNQKRLHSSLGYLPPNEFEQNMNKKEVLTRLQLS